jgi:hypothetical protein
MNKYFRKLKSLSFSIFLTLSVFQSCQLKKSQSSDVISIRDADFNENLTLKEGDDIKLTALTTGEESLLVGAISNIQITDNRIFLQDNKLHQLLIFDRNGTLINSLHALGEGPKEFKFIETFGIDNKNKKIVLFDSRTFKIIHFDFNGNFLWEHKTSFFIRSMSKIDQGWLTTNSWSNSNEFPEYAYIFDDNFELNVAIKEQSVKFSNLIADTNPFSINDYEIFFNEPLSNDIFHFDIKEQKFKKVITVDFSPNPLPDPNSFGSIRNFISTINDSNLQGWIRDLKVLENGNVLFKFIQYSEDSPSVSKILIKKSSQTLGYRYFEYKGLKIPFPKIALGNKLISVIPSELLENHISQLTGSSNQNDFWKNIFEQKPTAAILLEFEIQ